MGPNQACPLQPVVRLTGTFDDVLDGIDNITASRKPGLALGLSPTPSTMVVSSSVIVTFLALPWMSSVTFSSLIPRSSEIT